MPWRVRLAWHRSGGGRRSRASAAGRQSAWRDVCLPGWRPGSRRGSGDTLRSGAKVGFTGRQLSQRRSLHKSTADRCLACALLLVLLLSGDVRELQPLLCWPGCCLSLGALSLGARSLFPLLTRCGLIVRVPCLPVRSQPAEIDAPSSQEALALLEQLLRFLPMDGAGQAPGWLAARAGLPLAVASPPAPPARGSGPAEQQPPAAAAQLQQRGRQLSRSRSRSLPRSLSVSPPSGARSPSAQPQLARRLSGSARGRRRGGSGSPPPLRRRSPSPWRTTQQRQRSPSPWRTAQRQRSPSPWRTAQRQRSSSPWRRWSPAGDQRDGQPPRRSGCALSLLACNPLAAPACACRLVCPAPESLGPHLMPQAAPPTPPRDGCRRLPPAACFAARLQAGRRDAFAAAQTQQAQRGRSRPRRRRAATRAAAAAHAARWGSATAGRQAALAALAGCNRGSCLASCPAWGMRHAFASASPPCLPASLPPCRLPAAGALALLGVCLPLFLGAAAGPGRAGAACRVRQARQGRVRCAAARRARLRLCNLQVCQVRALGRAVARASNCSPLTRAWAAVKGHARFSALAALCRRPARMASRLLHHPAACHPAACKPAPLQAFRACRAWPTWPPSGSYFKP